MIKLPIVDICRIYSLRATLLALGLLCACGQKGNLVLPTEQAAQNRATLPQVLLSLPRPSASSSSSSVPPALPATPPASSAR